MAATTTLIQFRAVLPKLILGTGTGRCGTHTLADVLNQQPGANVTHEQRPRLPWRHRPGTPGIAERLQRLLRSRAAEFVGDVASFYLPYVEEAIHLEPDIRVICLERPREEVVESFCRWLDRVQSATDGSLVARPRAGVVSRAGLDAHLSAVRRP